MATSSLTAPSSAVSQAAFSPAGYQPNSPYGYISASEPSYSSGIHSQASQHYGFSSHGAYGGRTRTDSPAGQLLPSSPYESNNQSYPTGISLSSPTAGLPATSSSGLPSIGQSGSYGSTYTVGGGTHNHSPINTQPQPSQDPYPPNSLPPPSSGPYYQSHHYTHMSPTTPTTSSMMRPLSAPSTNTFPHPHPPALLPIQPQPHSHYRSPYSLPGMSGPIMVGPIHPSHHAGLPPPQLERPFKCDQCPQCFSRNHDLKRHKRIHLAVKPFPCDNCDKSFSRKDALKRHRLVKGCGKAADAKASEQKAGAQSPISPAADASLSPTVRPMSNGHQ
ncbi:hypothetical protein EDC01DRAFT_331932 [Geopyxis carbonaria]|nr:hypothetical protein EDC01DRAFT_331932 [Geopyxis carbonaria]